MRRACPSSVRASVRAKALANMADASPIESNIHLQY